MACRPRALLLASLALAIQRRRRRQEEERKPKRRSWNEVNGRILFLSSVKTIENIILSIFVRVRKNSNIYLALLHHL